MQHDMTVSQLVEFLKNSAIQARQEQEEAKLLTDKVNGDTDPRIDLSEFDDELIPRLNLLLANQQTLIEQNLEIIKKLDSVAGQSAKAVMSLLAQGEAMGGSDIVAPMELPPKPDKRKGQGKLKLSGTRKVPARRTVKHHNWESELVAYMADEIEVPDIAEKLNVTGSTVSHWLRKTAMRCGMLGEYRKAVAARCSNYRKK